MLKKLEGSGLTRLGVTSRAEKGTMDYELYKIIKDKYADNRKRSPYAYIDLIERELGLKPKLTDIIIESVTMHVGESSAHLYEKYLLECDYEEIEHEWYDDNGTYNRRALLSINGFSTIKVAEVAINRLLEGAKIEAFIGDLKHKILDKEKNA